jgi:predicted RNase H-like HicB family nuclease
VSTSAAYIALVHKDDGTSYGVSFPDVPGCISAGDTFGDALRNASEALAGHLRVMEADGDPVPAARTLEELRLDRDFVEDAKGAVVAVVVPETEQMTAVRSDGQPTAITEIAYEATRGELMITFSSGRRYVYDNVPVEIVEAFKASGSKAPFFNQEIRGRFSHREFDERFLVAAN